MFEWFFKADKSMGESVFARILGVILLVGIVIFAVVYKTN
jgi:hypothetical protein